MHTWPHFYLRKPVCSTNLYLSTFLFSLCLVSIFVILTLSKAEGEESPHFVLAVACPLPIPTISTNPHSGTTFGTRYPLVFDELTVYALACNARSLHTRNRCMGTVPVETNT